MGISKNILINGTISDLRVRAEGTLALLLVRLGSDPRVLDKREKIARSRLCLLDLVDPAPSRMRGFEVFRLYIVLLHRKMAVLKCNGKPNQSIPIKLLPILLVVNYGEIFTPPRQKGASRAGGGVGGATS